MYFVSFCFIRCHYNSLCALLPIQVRTTTRRVRARAFSQRKGHSLVCWGRWRRLRKKINFTQTLDLNGMLLSARTSESVDMISPNVRSVTGPMCVLLHDKMCLQNSSQLKEHDRTAMFGVKRELVHYISFFLMFALVLFPKFVRTRTRV